MKLFKLILLSVFTLAVPVVFFAQAVKLSKEKKEAAEKSIATTKAQYDTQIKAAKASDSAKYETELSNLYSKEIDARNKIIEALESKTITEIPKNIKFDVNLSPLEIKVDSNAKNNGNKVGGGKGAAVPGSPGTPPPIGGSPLTNNKTHQDTINIIKKTYDSLKKEYTSLLDFADTVKKTLKDKKASRDSLIARQEVLSNMWNSRDNLSPIVKNNVPIDDLIKHINDLYSSLEKQLNDRILTAR